jgi:hypothetical protein
LVKAERPAKELLVEWERALRAEGLGMAEGLGSLLYGQEDR